MILLQRLRRLARERARTTAYTVGLACVFVVINAQVAHAADGGGGMLGPLDVDSSEGVPIQGYELMSQPGSLFSFKANVYAWLMGGLFTLLRLLVGLACWAIEFAFRFPLLRMLTDPAQQASEAWVHALVDTLGLKGLMLSWGFIFSLVLVMRGRPGRGFGELGLTLVIGAVAASAFVRPDYLLGAQGPLAQTRDAAAEVAQRTVDSHDWGGKITAGASRCAAVPGGAMAKCEKAEGARAPTSEEIARPLQDSLTNALITKGYMLTQYGRILDPGKKADAKAYALHLKWVSGGYKPQDKNDGDDDSCSGAVKPAKDYCKAGEKNEDDEDWCAKVHGPARDICLKGEGGKKEGTTADGLPALTKGEALLESTKPVLTDEDRQFAAFLKDLKKEGGPVGKKAAAYAEEPDGWRTAGVLMLLVAGLLLCAIPLSGAVVLLGTQVADAGAAAAGGVCLVWGMLPGPSRQAVWKWLALLAMSMAVMFGVCMFLPFFGIAIDAIFTDGPDVPVERLLALDVVAVVGLALHRWLMRAISSFGQRLAMRMRYAKVGGTHLPGDSSEIGAALAMHASGAGGGLGGAGGLGLRGLAGGGAYGKLGTRARLTQALAQLADGTGMPVDSSRVLADAGAEAGRGLAPLAIGAAGLRLGAKGAWGLLVGQRPDDERLEKLRKPTAAGDRGTRTDGPGDAPGTPGGPGGAGGAGGRGGSGSGPGGPGRGGPADRYRDRNGIVADRRTGEVLHHQGEDRTLLSTRAHNRLVRLRGYRLAHRGGRVAYSSTLGLPETARRGATRTSQYTADVRQQVAVWGNTLRTDRGSWRPVGRGIATGARATRTGAVSASRSVSTAARTHGPAAARRARIVARDGAAAAGLLFGGTGRPGSRPDGGRAARSESEDPARAEARRRRLADLMRRSDPGGGPPGGSGGGGA